jgi:L-lactate dehydrogenase complex protein LldG
MSKDGILQSIRKHRAVFPAVSDDITLQSQLSSAERIDLFKKNLKAAGAEIIELKANELETYIASTYSGICDFSKPEVIAEYPANSPLEKLEKLEYALFPGNFGVAENGAIWLEDKDFPHRILPFITQCLVLKLDANKIVASMQEAYQQIQLKDLGFGVFISGPSKTADIEQSLVYGAHGAKELTVLMIAADK